MVRYLMNSGELLQYADGTIAKGAPIQVFGSRAGTIALTPLYSGADGTTVLSSGLATTINGEVPDFYGPDGVTDVWITAGGIRKHISGIDVETGKVVGQALSGLSDFPETFQDTVAAMMRAGANVTLAYDDTLGTITIAANTAGGAPTKAQTIGVRMRTGSNPWPARSALTGYALVASVGPDPSPTDQVAGDLRFITGV